MLESPEYISLGIQITVLPNMQFSPVSC
jgi:hypothetical protein